jgi:hypothetical protein
VGQVAWRFITECPPEVTTWTVLLGRGVTFPAVHESAPETSPPRSSSPPTTGWCLPAGTIRPLATTNWWYASGSRDGRAARVDTSAWIYGIAERQALEKRRLD